MFPLEEEVAEARASAYPDGEHYERIVLTDSAVDVVLEVDIAHVLVYEPES